MLVKEIKSIQCQIISITEMVDIAPPAVQDLCHHAAPKMQQLHDVVTAVAIRVDCAKPIFPFF